MWICVGKVNPKAGKKIQTDKKQLALKLVHSQDLCQIFEGRIWASGFSVCEFLSSWQVLFFFFSPLKIWIRIAVVYNASPKSRHQRMWPAAMNPLAVHTEYSWLLGRKKNRTKAIMSCHCDNPLVSLLRANKVDSLEVTTPSFPQTALCLQNVFSPPATWGQHQEKRKLQALVAPQSLSRTSDWNTSCNSVLFFSQQHHFP